MIRASVKAIEYNLGVNITPSLADCGSNDSTMGKTLTLTETSLVVMTAKSGGSDPQILLKDDQSQVIASATLTSTAASIVYELPAGTYTTQAIHSNVNAIVVVPMSSLVS